MGYVQEDYQRYTLPYGYFGVMYDVFSLYIFGMLICGRSPFLPFRGLRNIQGSLWICYVHLMGQVALHILNVFYINMENQELLSIAFIRGVVTFSAGVLICQALRKQRLTAFPQYLYSRGTPLPPRQRSSALPSTPRSDTVTEPPPPYAPRKETPDGSGTAEDTSNGIEMPNLGPSQPRPAVVNARLPSYHSSRHAGADDDGGESAIGAQDSTTTTPDRYTTRPSRQQQRQQSQYQHQQRQPRPLRQRVMFPAPSTSLLVIIIVLCDGIDELITHVPEKLLDQGLREDILHTEPTSKIYGKDSRKDTNLVINLVLGGVTLLAALVWSLCEHLAQARRRGVEDGRVGDYFKKLVTIKDQGELFWFVMAGGMMALTFYDISTADLLFGRAAGFRDGFVTHARLDDAGLVFRYWLYVFLGALPVFCY